ncbi:MAG: terpene cyclase/mutase family protein [Pirellulales bacterium]|nr:terpene cyclase/mutase family protein [Pirellulales bacterium]
MPSPGIDTKQYAAVVSQGAEFLSKAQSEDGSYSKQAGPGVTALATTALLRSGRGVDDPIVAKSLKYLAGFISPDGGIHQPNSPWANYETCISILCFTEANRDGRYDKLLADAEKFIRGIQWDEDEAHDTTSNSYGGAGYGGHKRPDLSNTQFLLDALKAAGAGPDDPAVQKALVFVSRCQNLESEHNTTAFAAKVNDGGFYYTPAAGGSSQAGKTDDGGLRSYGSMTYAGLKSMIYAGLTPSDPRVHAALGWLAKNYDLTQNPGMGDAGLFYYYHTLAKALAATGNDEFQDAAGKQHNWRQELVETLASKQRPDGAFANENARWMEGDPNLVTAYALLALSYCKP